MIKNPLFLKAMSAVILVASAAASSGAEPDSAAGQAAWTRLFNGRDLTGWTVQCKPADRAHTFWRVEEGTIVADSMDAGKHDYIWLETERDYTNFVLRLQFQAYKESPGNSGVQIRSRYDTEAGWLDGPQVDINPPGPWRTGMVWDETRGNQRWLYPPVPKGEWVNESMAKPGLRFYHSTDTPGWNTLEIDARGLKLGARLNGITVMEYDGAGVLDDSTHRARNVGTHGRIALQIHTGDRLRIRYKNIEIKELP